jgi:hypothetical protein
MGLNPTWIETIKPSKDPFICLGTNFQKKCRSENMLNISLLVIHGRFE